MSRARKRAAGHPHDVTPSCPLRQQFCFPPSTPSWRPSAPSMQILDDGVADFGVYADEPCFAWTALPDIRAIAAHILAYTTPDDLTNGLPADLVNAYRAAAKRPRHHGIPIPNPSLACRHLHTRPPRRRA